MARCCCSRGSTNYLQYSNDFVSPWVTVGGLTADYANAPDGTLVADRLQRGSASYRTYQNYATATSTVTHSSYIRATAGTSFMRRAVVGGSRSHFRRIRGGDSFYDVAARRVFVFRACHGLALRHPLRHARLLRHRRIDRDRFGWDLDATAGGAFGVRQARSEPPELRRLGGGRSFRDHVAVPASMTNGGMQFDVAPFGRPPGHRPRDGQDAVYYAEDDSERIFFVVSGGSIYDPRDERRRDDGDEQCADVLGAPDADRHGRWQRWRHHGCRSNDRERHSDRHVVDPHHRPDDLHRQPAGRDATRFRPPREVTSMPRSNIFCGARVQHDPWAEDAEKFLPHGRSFPNQTAGVRCILTGLIRVSSTAGAAPCLVKCVFALFGPRAWLDQSFALVTYSVAVHCGFRADNGTVATQIKAAWLDDRQKDQNRTIVNGLEPIQKLRQRTGRFADDDGEARSHEARRTANQPSAAALVGWVSEGVHRP